MLLNRCVLNLIKTVTITLAFVVVCIAYGAEQPSLLPREQQPGIIAGSPSSLDSDQSRFYEKLKETIGLTYFSFFYGPGLSSETFSINPNQLGKPENDGISFQNQFSVRYKFSKNMALDFQNRFRVFMNNGAENENFKTVRWETPRIGLSGRLLYGDDWSLTGAVNTDFPYFMPPPLSGFQAQQRTVVFNPGMFASFKYDPSKSRWSVFSVVSPRYFFYSERSAAEPGLSKAGFIPENKPEMIIAFQPTINYRVTSKMKLTAGTSIDYRKQVISNWNPAEASLVSNGDSTAWRLFAVPVTLGISYTFAQYLTVFPFVSTYPIAIQRKDAASGRQASLLEVSSVGMWINGTIF